MPINDVGSAMISQRSQPARSSAPPANSSSLRLRQSRNANVAGSSRPMSRIIQLTRRPGYSSARLLSPSSREGSVLGRPQAAQPETPERGEDGEGDAGERSGCGGGESDHGLGGQGAEQVDPDVFGRGPGQKVETADADLDGAAAAHGD